jgi:hypothetical protein
MVPVCPSLPVGTELVQELRLRCNWALVDEGGSICPASVFLMKSVPVHASAKVHGRIIQAIINVNVELRRLKSKQSSVKGHEVLPLLTGLPVIRGPCTPPLITEALRLTPSGARYLLVRVRVVVGGRTWIATTRPEKAMVEIRVDLGCMEDKDN